MSQTYKFGNGTWARKKGSTLAYSDTNNAFKPLPFSFERNSIATRVNKEGLIEVVGNDIPRIDYTDSTEGALLLENSATNLITYSEDFSNSYWIKNGLSVTSGFLSPKGDLSAFKITEDNANSVHKIQNNNGIANSFQSQSIFVKYDSSQQFIQTTSSRSINNYVNFDILNKTSKNYGTSVGKIVELNNGWLRLDVYHDSSTTIYWHFITSLNASWSETYLGTEKHLLIFGSQVEVGNATSYIPTNGSTVQRAAETCSGSGNSEVFNDSQGVLFADIAALSDDLTSRSISLSDGTYNNSLILQYRNLTNTISIKKFTTILSTFTVPSTTNYLKIAINYSSNNIEIYLNGFLIDTNNTFTSFPSNTLDSLSFDRSDGGEDFYGKTKEIGYYDTALTDEELEYLTSYRSLNEMVTELNLNAL